MCHPKAVCHRVCGSAAVFSAADLGAAIKSANNPAAISPSTFDPTAISPTTINPAAISPTAFDPAAINPTAIREAKEPAHVWNTGSGHGSAVRWEVQHHPGSQSSKSPPVWKSDFSNPGSWGSVAGVGHGS